MGANNQILDQILIQAKSLSGLQGSLLSAAKGKTVRSILVTSGRNKEGKSTVAIGLAAALAENAKVLLVDSNFRNPVLSDVFQVSAAPGLSEVLGGSELSSATRETGVNGLSLLPAGGDGSIAANFRSLKSGLDALVAEFDYVVFDGDSALSSSEAALLAGQVDGVILVAECEQTKREIINLCQEKLSSLGGNILGVVLNKRQFYIPGALYGKV